MCVLCYECSVCDVAVVEYAHFQSEFSTFYMKFWSISNTLLSTAYTHIHARTHTHTHIHYWLQLFATAKNFSEQEHFMSIADVRHMLILL